MLSKNIKTPYNKKSVVVAGFLIMAVSSAYLVHRRKPLLVFASWKGREMVNISTLNPGPRQKWMGRFGV